MRRAGRRAAWVVAATAVAALPGLPAAAVTCTVPGSHPSVTAAVADAACTTIEVSGTVDAGLVQIHRPLELRGPVGGAATLQGAILVLGRAGAVSLARLDLRPSGGAGGVAWCEGLQVEPGAEVTAEELDIVPAVPPCRSPIFVDDLETGDLSRWSSAAP